MLKIELWFNLICRADGGNLYVRILIDHYHFKSLPTLCASKNICFYGHTTIGVALDIY